MAAASLEPGDPRVLGAFQLTGRLGEGGQGVVYLAHGPDGERVAVKTLKADVDPRARERLARELAACERVASFCTARVICSSIEGPHTYVVSEYVAGPSLQERVEREGPLREGELDRLVVGTITALTAIHGAGVLHRDLKPANVLLGPDGPRVVDFGIARPIDADTVTTHLVGTPAYLAPEQLNGEPPSPATDVFAWACTMVFAATGRPAFGNDTIAAVLNRIAHATPDLTEVPPRLRGPLAACLAKDPARRPRARTLLMRLVDPTAETGAEQAVGRGAEHGAEHGAEQGVEQGAAPFVTSTTVLPLPERARRRILAPAGVGLAALLLTAAVTLLAFGPRDGDVRAPASSEPVPAASVGSVGSSPAESADRTVPDAFGGTWHGEATESEDGAETARVPIVVTLAAGRREGRLELPEDECEGVLDLVDVAGEELTFRLAFHSGDCLDGTVALIRHGDEELEYHWERRGGESAEATLRRGG
jgi:hypothetical protein